MANLYLLNTFGCIKVLQKSTILLIGLVAVLMVDVLHAAGFMCTDNLSKVEQLICNDKELYLLDDYLTILYQDAAARAPLTKEKNGLKKQQTAWLALRNDCKENTCLLDAYHERIKQLQALVKSSGVLRDDASHLSGEWSEENSDQDIQSTVAITKVDKAGFDFKMSANNGEHTGEMEGVAHFFENVAIVDLLEGEDEDYCIFVFSPAGKKIEVSHYIKANASGFDVDNCGYGGVGVTFDGTYVKNKKIESANLVELGLLKTPEEEKVFQAMTGKDYNLFIENCGGLIPGDNLIGDNKEEPPILQRGTTYVSSFTRGDFKRGCVIMRRNNYFWAAVSRWEKNGDPASVVSKGDTTISYYTNDSASQKKIPLPIKKWIKSINAHNVLQPEYQ